VCTHQGFPLVVLPGANIFFTDRDETSPDGVITCKPIDPARAGYDIVKVSRLLLRLAELAG
jgi:hypothetical protein